MARTVTLPTRPRKEPKPTLAQPNPAPNRFCRDSRKGQPMTQSDDQARIKVREMLERIGIVMLVTMQEDGSHRARPMAIQKIENETLWFFNAHDSAKTRELAGNEDVVITAADSNQNYVSATGQARAFRDVGLQKELWSESARVWFPKGPEDESMGLIEVILEGAEFWDSPSSTALHAYGYVKAVLTGRSPNGGENVKVGF